MSVFTWQGFENLVTSRGLPVDSTSVLKAEPDELDIKKHEPDILFFQFTHCFSLQTIDNDVIFDFCVDSTSLATSFKKYNVIMT